MAPGQPVRRATPQDKNNTKKAPREPPPDVSTLYPPRHPAARGKSAPFPGRVCPKFMAVGFQAREGDCDQPRAGGQIMDNVGDGVRGLAPNRHAFRREIACPRGSGQHRGQASRREGDILPGGVIPAGRLDRHQRTNGPPPPSERCTHTPKKKDPVLVPLSGSRVLKGCSP